MNHPSSRHTPHSLASTPHLTGVELPGSVVRPNPNLLKKAVKASSGAYRRYSAEVSEAFRAAARDRTVIEPTHAQAQWMRGFPSRDLAAMWIGHATMLLRVGGQTVLTDPVLGERIGMTVGGGRRAVTFGLSRLAPPGLDLEHLPHIDLILLSHAHFDHLDRPSLKRLARGPARGATVITARRTAALVPKSGFGRVLELDWNSSLRAGGLEIDAVKPAHWGARTAIDHYRRWNSYVIRHGAHRVLFAGDTAFTDAFQRVGPVDLAIFGIGAYEPWSEAHANPEQAWRMFKDLRARRLAPMHHSTFKLGEEPVHEPLERLERAAANDADRVVCKNIGDAWCASGEHHREQSEKRKPKSEKAESPR